jgi:anti-sigma factor RsiW
MSMPHTPHDPEPAPTPMDLYLDGLMSPCEAEAFERQIEGDAHAQATVRAHRQMVAQLRGAFAVPAAPVSAPVEVESPALAGRIQRARSNRLSWLGAVAAVLLIGAALVPFITFGTRPASVVQVPAYKRPSPVQMVSQAYADQVALGMVPQEVCTTDEQFTRWTQSTLGQPMKPQGLPAEVTLVGWSYTGALSAYTSVLLARAGDEPVVVLMDASADASALPEPGVTEGVHRHLRTIGRVEMVELSRLDKPVVLPALTQVEPLPEVEPQAQPEPGAR